jgi:hypothetical protein
MKTKTPLINAWAKAREEQAIAVEAIKKELAAKHGIPRNAKFERAWDIAWEYGHSSGFDEVRMYFDELADLLKP